MIIVYTNKPSISSKIAPCLSKKYPMNQIIYIHSMYFMNVHFDYPQTIKWKQFPYLQDPLFSIRKLKNWKPFSLINGRPEFVDLTFQDIMQCEKIIYAADKSPTDSYLFSKFIEIFFNKTIYEMDIDSIYLSSLAELDILNSIDNMVNFSTEYSDIINQGKIIKYFDYNFNFNSFALFGRAYQEVNLLFGHEKKLINMSGRIFISKNMLQLLYFIRYQQANNINYNLGSLVYQMQNWKGTGKYNFKVQLGNCISCSTIIENLITLKLLQNKNKMLYLTDKGKTFLHYLPKDCIDLDLLFRIELWSQESFEDSKIKIDKYLSNYYNKVKNKLKLY